MNYLKTFSESQSVADQRVSFIKKMVSFQIFPFQFEDDSPREDILKWQVKPHWLPVLPPVHRGPPDPSLLVIDHPRHLDHLKPFDHPNHWSSFHAW